MKKKITISIILIVLITLPLFAFGGKEKASNTATQSTSTQSSASNTQVATAPVEAVETKETVAETENANTSSISNPVYKVELTEATYITEEDVNEAVAYLKDYYGTDIAEEDATEYLINQILFNQALVRALENNEIPLYDGTFNDYVSYQLSTYASYYGIELTTTEEAESFLEQFGMTYEDFANQVLQDYAEQYYIGLHSNGKLEQITEPTEEEILEFYNSNITYFISSESVQLSHIYFAFGDDKQTAKVKADTCSSNISKGLSFEDAVKTYSDDTTTKENAGAFGVWISSDDSGALDSFGETAMNEIYSLAVGQVSGVVEGVQGYHIFKVTDKKAASLLDLDDLFDLNYEYTVSDVIAQQLYSNKQTLVYAEIYEDIITSLREEATIKSLK